MVATREGGVDRNTLNIKCIGETAVATREGGVDRNVEIALTAEKNAVSPPARVAWIETPWHCFAWRILPVATREGGVDRN